MISLDASAEMGLISPGGENHLDFLELRQVLSTYDWDLRDPLWWRQERPVPMRVARGPLGIPLPSVLGPKTLCGVSAGNLGFLSSADMDHGCTSGVSPGESVLVSSGDMHVRFPPEL